MIIWTNNQLFWIQKKQEDSSLSEVIVDIDQVENASK